MTMPNGNGLKDIQKKRDAWKTLQLYNPSLKVFGDDVFTGDGEIKPEVWEAYSNLKGDAMNVPAIQAAMRGEPAQQPAAAGPPPTPQVLPEDVPPVQSYFDPKVWTERGQRIGRGLGSAFGTAAQAAGISPPPMPQPGDAGWKAPPTILGRVTAAGRAFAEAPPEATAVQRFLAPLTELEPELGALEAFQEITDPVRGHLYTRENVYGLFEQEVKQRYDILRERGVDHISALAAASRQAEQAGEIGGFKSFLINMLTDPAELTPSVGITAGLGKAGLRQIAKMGATTSLKVPKGAAAAIARQQADPSLYASLLRTVKAAPEPGPVGRRIEIGDDVVFPGPDGDISGKVTGKGVTEIEGISKPHLTVRYETPSGIKEEFVSEGMARSLTPPQAARDVPEEILPTDVTQAAGKPPITPTAAGEAGVSPIMADFPTDFDKTVQIMVRPDNWRRFANLPGVRAVQGKFNPSGVANNPINQAAAGRARLRDDANTLVQRTMVRLDKLGSQETVFGKLDDKGLIAEGPLKGLAVNDIRTYPQSYASRTTPEIKEWIRVAGEIENAKLDYLKKNDIDIHELAFDEGGQYAGRRVWGMTNELGEVENIAYVGTGPKRPGAKLAAEKPRIFPTAAEAIEAGYRYIPDDEALTLNVRGAYNRVVDQRYADWLLDGRIDWRRLGTSEGVKAARESAKRRLALAKRSIEKLQDARRGATLPTGTVNAIERLFPQLEGRLREPTRVRVADVLKAAKKLDEPERVFEVPKFGAIQKVQKLLAAAQKRLDADLGNPALQKEVDRLERSLRFIRYRIGLGEPLTVPHNVVKALRQDAIKDLDELLGAIRGTLVKRPGLKPAYEGGLIADIRRETAQTLKMAKKAREISTKPSADEDIVPVPAFAGKAFSKETAKSLRKTMDPGFSKALAQVNKAGAVSRYFMLGGDISPMQIQLLFLMGESPRTWVKAGRGFYDALRDPRFLARYFDRPENQAILQKYPGLRLTRGGQSEFTEAIARGGALSPDISLLPAGEGPLKTAALMAPRAFGKVVGPTVRPFARGFEGALDVAGVEMAKALDHYGTTAARREDLAQFINKFRGVTSSARLGVGTKTRQVETLALLAPQYNRAIAALLFDLVHGGLSGDLARKALARGVGAVSAMAVAISLARGESPEETLEHFKPIIDGRNNPKFMTWKIANQNIGPGSKVRSVISLFAKSAVNPERLLYHPWGDYEYMRNPIIRFGRAQTGPVVSTGWDLLTGKDYIGDPTRDGMLQMTETVAKRFMYIWAQSALFEGGTPVDRLSRGATEFMGWRAYPTPPYERREERGGEMREEIAEELGISGTYEEIKNERGYGAGEAWAGMDLTQIPETYGQQDPKTKLLMGSDEEMAKLSQRSREDAKRRGGAWGDYYQEVDLLWDNDDKESLGVLQELEALWEASEILDSGHPGELYREKRSQIFTQYYRDKEKALKRAKKRGAFEDKDPEGPFAVGQDVYNRLLFADDSSEEYKIWVKELIGPGYEYMPLEDELGFNWDERERRIEHLVRSYSQQFVDDMKALAEANPTRLLPEAELNYRRAVEYIKDTGYWDVDKTLASQYGVSAELEEYKRLDRTKKPEARKYLTEHEVLRKGVKNKERDAKRMMRLRNPELDEVLVRYGWSPARAQRTGQDFWGGVRFGVGGQ